MTNREKTKTWLKPRLVKIAAVIAVLTLTSVFKAMSQEFPVYNQYYFNYYLVNPALAGVNDCHYFMLTHKQQWLGIDDAPYTTSLSYQGRLKYNIGIGAYVYNDKNGYSGQQAGEVTFAYHIPLSDGQRWKKAVSRDRQLSFGLSAKIYNYGISDKDELQKLAENDEAMKDLDDVLAFNLNLGAYFESYGFFTGLSVTNLLGMKMPNYDGDMEPLIPFTGYFLLGNEFMINDFEGLEPSLMYMFDVNGDMTFDVNFKYTHQSSKRGSDWSYWLQLTMRQNIDEGSYEALTIIPVAGLQYQKLHFGLAYGIDCNRLFRHNYGSLELMLGYTLCQTRRFCR